MKKSFLIISILIAICAGFPLYAKSTTKEKTTEPKLGEVIEKTIKINGKKAPYKLILDVIIEYDENGNEVHINDLDEREVWAEYDSNGKLKHRKSIISSRIMNLWYDRDEHGNITHYLIVDDDRGTTEFFMEYDENDNKIYEQSGGSLYRGKTYKYWYEYDSSGKLLHRKCDNGFEAWYEYDKKGQLTRIYNSDGTESLYKYDSQGNKIYFKDVNFIEEWWEFDKKGNNTYHKNSTGQEEWFDYDSKGNKIHEKSTNNNFEVWMEYDSNGNLICSRNSYGTGLWFEYEFYSNKKIKIKKQYVIMEK